MSPLWSILFVSVIVNDCINAAVIVRRRPISIQERVPFTSTTTQATTTTTFEPEEEITVVNRLSRLTLPSNATSIRSDITDSFSCAGRGYGYYADVENDCQLFHVCLPVTYPDGQEREFRWSFICPEETIFNQEAFICARADEMNIDCSDSENFYELNRMLGLKEETSTDEVTNNELTFNENSQLSSHEKYSEVQNKEYNQRFKPVTPNRIISQSGSIRNQINRKTPANTTPNVNTERVSQTTNYIEPINDRSESTAVNELSPSTSFPPVNINQFFDLTTRKPYNYPTTTLTENTESTTDSESGTTTPVIDYTTNKYDYSNTRIIPDLYEESTNKAEQSKTDEVIESIKQLQKLYPSNSDDSRDKRFLFKADSVRNRQKLFAKLNQ